MGENTNMVRRQTQPITALRLIDDDMIGVALQDQQDLVQYILRIILRMPDLVVTQMETRADFLYPANYDGPPAFDIWAADADGTEYRAAMQRMLGGPGSLPLRQQLCVLDVTLRGEMDSDKLPETSVILISDQDDVGGGRLLRRFALRDENGLELEESDEILILNTAFAGPAWPGPEEIAALAHDLQCADPENMKLKPLADRMRFLKGINVSRSEMGNVIEEYAGYAAKKAAVQAVHEARRRDLDRAHRLDATGKLSVFEVASLFELDAAEILDMRDYS